MPVVLDLQPAASPPHPPAVDLCSSVGSDPQLDELDQIFTERSAPCSERVRPWLGRGRSADGPTEKRLGFFDFLTQIR